MANEFIARRGFISLDGAQITGSLSATGNISSNTLTVTSGITGTATSASYVEYSNVAGKPALVSSSAQIVGYNVFATTGSNQFNGAQAITGSLTVTGQVVAQTLNVQQVTSSIVYSSGSNVFGNSLDNTQQFTGSMSVTGSLAVAGALSGTSGTLTGALIVENNAITQDGTRPIITLQQSGTSKVFLGVSSGASDLVIGDSSGDAVFRKPASSGAFRFSVDGGTSSALVLASTGAATFSSSVTAGGLIKSTNNGAGFRHYYNNGSGNIEVSQRSDSKLQMYAYNGTGYTDILLGVDGATIGGNVGIGTSGPNNKLTVWTSSTTGLQTALRLNNPFGFANQNTGAKIVFSQDRNTSENLPMGEMGVGQEAPGTSDYGYMFFSTLNGTMGERMRITSAGGYLRMASGTGGIQFNGDTAAANALDDYEEGTWTPTFLGGTTNPTVSYAVRTGSYTKIGRQVTCNFEIGTTSNTGGDGNIRISGLPFTVGIRSYMAVATYNINNTATDPMSIFVEINASGTEMLLLQTADNATWANITWSQATNSVIYVNATITYFV